MYNFVKGFDLKIARTFTQKNERGRERKEQKKLTEPSIVTSCIYIHMLIDSWNVKIID